MTSPARAFAILNLFSEAVPVWHADEINLAMGYARATGYRYVKDLVEFGFLRKVSAGRYSLGPRIIELDYRLRRSDPLLKVAVPVMNELVVNAGLDAVLTTLFGTQLVDIHRSSIDPTLQLTYGRGRPRPLLAGAAAKVIASHLNRGPLLKIYCDGAEAARQGLGQDWSEFRKRLSDIRREGFYWSKGELEPNVSGAAVAILGPDGEIAAALALVGMTQRLQEVGETRLKELLAQAKEVIQQGL
jgi:DNA-binding IclR family transcriptional regulator